MVSGRRPSDRVRSVMMTMIACAVLGFGIHRAATLSFTHDESFSFLNYVHQPSWDLLTLKDPYTNNHLLNSLGMKWSSRWFGSSELALRLPNLLLLAVFLTYAALLLRRLPVGVSIAAYILLCANIDMLDLGTLARGYGLSMGFMMAAIHHLVAALEERSIRDLVLFHVAGLLAVLSSFTLLVFLATAMALVPLLVFLTRSTWAGSRWSARRFVAIHLGCALGVVSLLWIPVRQVATGNAFDFGGKTSFYDSTVRSLIYRVFTGSSISDGMLIPLQVLFTAVIAIAVFLCIRSLRKGGVADAATGTPLLVSTGVFVGTCSVSIAQHQLLGTDYLEARFGMFLVPLFLLVVIWVTAELSRKWPTWLSTLVMAVIAYPTLLGFHRLAFPLRGAEWYYDVETDLAMDLLDQHHHAHGDTTTNAYIGNSWVLEPTINFYRIQRPMPWLERAHRDGCSPEDDYRFLLLDGLQAQDTVGFITIGRSERAGTLLLARAHPKKG